VARRKIAEEAGDLRALERFWRINNPLRHRSGQRRLKVALTFFRINSLAFPARLVAGV
jgi:hypothetical protein